MREGGRERRREWGRKWDRMREKCKEREIERENEGEREWEMRERSGESLVPFDFRIRKTFMDVKKRESTKTTVDIYFFKKEIYIYLFNFQIIFICI